LSWRFFEISLFLCDYRECNQAHTDRGGMETLAEVGHFMTTNGEERNNVALAQP